MCRDVFLCLLYRSQVIQAYTKATKCNILQVFRASVTVSERLGVLLFLVEGSINGFFSRVGLHGFFFFFGGEIVHDSPDNYSQDIRGHLRIPEGEHIAWARRRRPEDPREDGSSTGTVPVAGPVVH